MLDPRDSGRPTPASPVLVAQGQKLPSDFVAEKSLRFPSPEWERRNEEMILFGSVAVVPGPLRLPQGTSMIIEIASEGGKISTRAFRACEEIEIPAGAFRLMFLRDVQGEEQASTVEPLKPQLEALIPLAQTRQNETPGAIPKPPLLKPSLLKVERLSFCSLTSEMVQRSSEAESIPPGEHQAVVVVAAGPLVLKAGEEFHLIDPQHNRISVLLASERDLQISSGGKCALVCLPGLVRAYPIAKLTEAGAALKGQVMKASFAAGDDAA